MNDGHAPRRAILHVDMDAFYASVEQRDQPELRGKPLVVGGTTNRGVVAAASYEARRYGVRSAMPIRQALERCPELVRVPVRMARYREVSSQVFAVFHEHASQVQGLSLDEAYLDVTEAATASDIETIGKRIKDLIKDRTALTASVGMAHN
ncbi:MAG: DNA polymerase IV, partial [Pseudomonadota bacterium]